jgi:hypothetical protein
MRAIQWVSEKFKQVRSWFAPVTLIPANSPAEPLDWKQRILLWLVLIFGFKWPMKYFR